jgi:hypothetical protein
VCDCDPNNISKYAYVDVMGRKEVVPFEPELKTWWAYLHKSGHIAIRAWKFTPYAQCDMCHAKEDKEKYGNDFIAEIVGPFKSSQEDREKIAQYLFALVKETKLRRLSLERFNNITR